MSVPQHILEAEKRMEESIKALQSENTAEEATPAEEPAAQEDKAEEPNGPGFEESAPEGESKDDDPEDLAALDAVWAEAQVTFGPDPNAGCPVSRDLLARMDAAPAAPAAS